THKLSSPLGPQDQNRFEIVTELENHQGCMVSNTIDLNPLLKAASSNILETSRLSHIESAPDVTSHKADAADPKQEKTWAEKLTEKVRRLKGEKVTILGTEPLQCLSAPSDGVPYLFYRYEDEKKENRLSVNKYAQHTGVILEAKLTERTTPEIVIQLDKTGEKIVTDNEHGMGFHSELDAAKGLIGRSLWPKTRFATIAVTTDPCRYSVSDERLSLKKLQKVTITRVEFGEQNNHIFIFVKTDEGREGPLYVSGGIVFDENFHGLEKYVSMGAPFSQEFFLDDPRKLHPTWSEAIWKLIEEGNVAIGMTEEMVKLACVDSMSGGKLQEEGFVISPSGNEISTTYKCSGKRFVIEKGKVTTYVYER
ncbi:MAG: hypothetical protein LAO31_19650, partial [Acidobacteriia bacterium]|nr:hypothetical protein [Terriglobia bacterium]